jgi:hypothetical protein
MSEEQIAVEVEAGRRRRSWAEAEQLVREFEASGLRRREFCCMRGLAMGTLDIYRRRQRQEKVGGSSGLVAVELKGEATASASTSGLAVVLRSGWRIEVSAGFDASTLERLVGVLEPR